jgi:predicted CoA-binding protein
VTAFLEGRRYAVAGVSRDKNMPANAIFRRLREAGYEVVPVNPKTDVVEGVRCYPDLASVPGSLDGVLGVTHPTVAADVVRQAAARGVRRVWFHRSFGEGSVSRDALEACAAAGIVPVEGGCPMMYCGKVDPAHRLFRWWFRMKGKIPR